MMIQNYGYAFDLVGELHRAIDVCKQTMMANLLEKPFERFVYGAKV